MDSSLEPKRPESMTGRPPGRRLAVVSALAAVVLCAVCFGASGLVAAVLVAPTAYLSTLRVSRRTAAPDRAESEYLPVVLELLAAAIRAGAPLSTALTSVAATAPGTLGSSLGRTAALLRFGAPPSQAWASADGDPRLRPLAAVAARSADSGIRMADGLVRQAAALRADLRSADAVRAGRVGVAALLPVGLCFLPAFVCVGIVPIVFGVASDAFGRLSP